MTASAHISRIRPTAVQDPPGNIQDFLEEAFTQNALGSARLKLLSSNKDFPWDDLVRYSIDYFLAPALPFELKRKEVWNDIPSPVRNVLEFLAGRNRVRNRTILAVLSRLNTDLNRAGIPAVTLKGAACLAWGVYVEPERRFMIDVDVLVPKDLFRKAVGLLLNSGYVLFEPGLAGDPMVGKHYHPLLPPDRSIAIEVHRCLGRLNAFLSPDKLLRDSIELSLDGVSIRVPLKEDILAHHVLHAQEFLRDRIRPRPRHVADLAVLIAAWEREIDWLGLLRSLKYPGTASQLCITSRSAIELLTAVRLGKGIFTARASAQNVHESLLRRCPGLRYADPVYLRDMWAAEKLRRLARRCRTPQSRAWLCRRMSTRQFWSRAVAELKSL